MELIIKEMQDEIKQGDFLLVEKEGVSDFYIIVLTANVKGVVNLRSGEMKYSISKERSYTDLIDHVRSFEEFNNVEVINNKTVKMNIEIFKL